MIQNKSLLEVCAGDIASVDAAVVGGAGRVELCSALALGGLTPSAGFISAAVERGLPCNVLIRPRQGDFVYSPPEVSVMLADIDVAARCGANGVVVGALRPDGSIDIENCRRLVDRARSHGLAVTFHRAFDRAADLLTALGDVLDLGADNLLTSGGAPSALQGADVLRRLNNLAAGRITLIAAAGVSSDNAAEIVRRSGCRQLHASARVPVVVDYTANNDVAMGSADGPTNKRMTTSADTVRAIISSMP